MADHFLLEDVKSTIAQKLNGNILYIHYIKRLSAAFTPTLNANCI